jgi:hypothetical protein
LDVPPPFGALPKDARPPKCYVLLRRARWSSPMEKGWGARFRDSQHLTTTRGHEARSLLKRLGAELGNVED